MDRGSNRSQRAGREGINCGRKERGEYGVLKKGKGRIWRVEERRGENMAC
jgi:hypothetical protein